MRPITIEFADSSYRVHRDSWFDRIFYKLELTAMPERDIIRVPAGLLEEFEKRFGNAASSISVHWSATNARSSISMSTLKNWPSAARWRLTKWADSGVGHATWVGLEKASEREDGRDAIVLTRPGAEVALSAMDGKWTAAVLGFAPWRSMNRPHIWPTYELYDGANGELILYIMGSLARGRFKLAKTQLDEFLAFKEFAPLHLGFCNPEQGIDVTLPIENLRLTRLKNSNTADAYYLIDVHEAMLPPTTQLCLAL